MRHPGAADDEGEDHGKQRHTAIQEAAGATQRGMAAACPGDTAKRCWSVRRQEMNLHST